MFDISTIFSEEFSMTRMFIYIASGVGFFAVALIVGVSCKRFVVKRRGDKFRRPYDEPRPYRAGMSATGEDEEDDE